MRRGVVALCAGMLFLCVAGAANAAPGDVLRTLHPSVCAGGTYGVAMDGSAPLVTCPVGPGQTPTIYKLKAKNGKVSATYTANGLASGMTIYGLGYNAQTELIVVCVSAGGLPPFQLGTVSPLTDVYQAIGQTTDCSGGLEVDQARRVWSTPYGGSAVHQISPTTGGTLKTIPLPALSPCGTTGVAVESGSLFVSTVDPDTQLDCGAWQTPIKQGSSTQLLAPGTPGLVSDLTCDNKTFKATHATAIWAGDGLSSTLIAYEAPGSGDVTTPKCK